MPGQARHLGQIAHGGFAAVRLPVGIGGETDRGVECEVRSNRPQPLRVERQVVLQTLDGVGDQNANGAEDQERDGVLNPTLLVACRCATQTEQPAFDGCQHPARWALGALEHAVHVVAERLGDGQHDQKERQNLQPTVESHDNSLEALRTEQGVDQIEADSDGNGSA